MSEAPTVEPRSYGAKSSPSEGSNNETSPKKVFIAPGVNPMGALASEALNVKLKSVTRLS